MLIPYRLERFLVSVWTSGHYFRRLFHLLQLFQPVQRHDHQSLFLEILLKCVNPVWHVHSSSKLPQTVLADNPESSLDDFVPDQSAERLDKSHGDHRQKVESPVKANGHPAPESVDHAAPFTFRYTA